MRAVWKGAISFGLVNIPVALVNASMTEELKFRLLRGRDLSPVNYKRVAEVDGREVPWNEIVKGYEYEKGKFVVLKDEDFKRVDLEATDTIDIVDFVDLAEINPVYFYKPYYLEPTKGGSAAYHLLREVLADTRKAGISKVIIRTRQHLAAVKANGDLLVLELMRFSNELVPPESIHVTAEKKPRAREIAMARTLVNQMSEEWDPKRYTDEYRSALMALIDKKVAAGAKELPAGGHAPRRATNVIDLASMLQQSLKDAAASKRAKPAGVSGGSAHAGRQPRRAVRRKAA